MYLHCLVRPQLCPISMQHTCFKQVLSVYAKTLYLLCFLDLWILHFGSCVTRHHTVPAIPFSLEPYSNVFWTNGWLYFNRYPKGLVFIYLSPIMLLCINVYASFYLGVHLVCELVHYQNMSFLYSLGNIFPPSPSVSLSLPITSS